MKLLFSKKITSSHQLSSLKRRAFKLQKSLLIGYLLLLPVTGWSMDFVVTDIATTPTATNEPLNTQQTAGSVFIDFAKKVLGTNYAKTFKSKWEKQVTYDTMHWQASEAHQFLSFLTNRIEPLAVVNVMQSPSYFRYFNVTQFEERVLLYTSYIGEKAVNARLTKSLGGFHVGQIDTIQSNLEFVRSYINNPRESSDIINRQLYAFSLSVSNINNLPQIVQLLESYISKKDVIFVIQGSIQALLRTPISRLKTNISFLEKYFSRNKVAFMMKKGFNSFIDKNFKDIKNTIAFLENYLNKSDIILGLSTIPYPFKKEFHNLQQSINFLVPYIDKKRITKKLQSSLIILSENELKHLKNMEKQVSKEQVITYLENNIFNSQLALPLQPHVSASSKYFYNTAAFVFIDFAKKQLGDDYEKKPFGSEWETGIINNTKYWQVNEAHQFLNFLVNRIGSLAVANAMTSTSYFIQLKFDDFKKRVHLYSQYIGEETVNARLKKSLGGFHVGQIDTIQSNLEFVRSYIQSDKIFHSIMKKNISGLHIMQIKKLSKVIQFLESYLSKEEVIEIAQKSFYALTRTQVDILGKRVYFLENYLSRNQIAWKIKKNFNDFKRGDFNQLKHNIEFLEAYMGKTHVTNLIEKHFHKMLMRLTRMRIERLKEAVYALEQQVGKEQVIKNFIKIIVPQASMACKKAFQ